MPKIKKPIYGSKEMRAFSMPDLSADEKGNTIEGHAAVFGQTVNMYDCWNETIARGAFDKTDFSDVLFTVNHDFSQIPLAHSRNNNANSTLQLQIDGKGLNTKALLDTENNSAAKALYGSVQRADINGMSFTFSVGEDAWTGLDTDMPSRTIISVSKVYEVSAVSMPAYDGTDINARSQKALDGAKKVLDNARAHALDSTSELRNSDLEILRLKNEILSKG